ncbi:MAG: ATP-binding cassette domain-containing protein [Patescibacteria group bacterium]|jgi:macrolide transport system ATP-binding/permease protein
MTHSIIKISALKKSFRVGSHKVDALRGVDLEIYSGDFVVVFGPSGCGKTTLLSLLAGLDKPTSGQVIVRGADLAQMKEKDLALYRRSKIGMVFQQFNLVSMLSARDNISLPLTLAGTTRKESDSRAVEMLKAVGLSDRAKHRPGELSGGEQQRIAVARAMAANPWILLVDEPTGNLDEPTGLEIMKLLKQVNKWGRTIILVTHNPEYLEYGNRIIYMRDGRVAHEKNSLTSGECFVEDHDLPYYIAAHKNRGLRFFDMLRLSRLHFLGKRLRTALTTLGIALGVGSIITLVSLGIGLQQITSSQIASFEALKTITVTVGKDSVLNLDDNLVDRLTKIPNVALVSPTLSLPGKITLGGATTQTMVYGIRSDALALEGIKTDQKNGLSADDSILLSRAALKGLDIKDESGLLGKTARFQLTVLPQGNNLSLADLRDSKNIDIEGKIEGSTSDDVVVAAYVPLSRLKTLTGSTQYNSVKVRANDRKNVEAIRDSVEKLGLSTTSVTDLVKQIDRVFLIIQIVLGVIGAVGLLVALLGIINIMTISLLERTHEVGIMKAIGATNKDVKQIFQYEVIFFGFWGGLVGITGSLLFGWLINSILAYLASASNIETSLKIFVTPFYFGAEMLVLTVLVALLAGWYPAKRASRLSPMEALRYE